MKKTLLFASIAGLLSMASCTKNNVQTFPDNTVQYTVQAVSGANLGTPKTGSVDALSGASVSVNQNGKVTTVTTGADGLAAFKVQPGTVAVTISASNFTTVNYIAQVVIPQTNGGTVPGTTVSQSYSSSQAVLFPTNAGTAIISGHAFITSDYTASAANQLVQTIAGTKVNAYIDNSQLAGYVTSTAGNGAITSISYEGTAFQGSLGSDGAYSITVPAAGAKGLVIDVKFDDVDPTLMYPSPTPSQRTPISGPTYSVTVYSGQTTIHGDTHYN